AAEPAEETPIMYFFELKDKLTVNAIVYHAKAVSSADAKGALRNFYIQTGVTKYSIHCNEKTMTEEEVRKRPGYSGYLVWQGSGDDKIVVMRK
ncbi:MAG: hypothetical protein NTY56_01075, partial [Patescibacteria group bacterium]|nr:hypothetical protein [Patescibacteria group bacterium]